MSVLIKRGKKYLSKISVRVGKPQDNKKKVSYVKLDTDRYSYAKTRNAIVTREEQKIRKEIRLDRATKSDLLNINNLIEWEWLKLNGTSTSIKLHTLSEYVDKFIKYNKIKKRRKSTIDSYGYALKKLIMAIGKNVLISDINEEHIDKFIEYLEYRKLSLSSIDSNLKSVNAFLNWCKNRSYISKSPIVELFRPILEDKWLTEDEYSRIIKYKNYTNKRYPQVFKLYAETGMRLAEGFYGILTEDENGIWLAIPNEHSKSKRGRTIQLNEEQRDTIIMMQELFNVKGRDYQHIKYYSRIFKKVKDALGIDKHKSFHSLRHYFGKRMVTITGSIYKVSGLMGHSSVKVTEDSYVKGFDRKSTLRDFPSLKEYLINPKNDQKVGVGTLNWVHNEQSLNN